MKKSIFSLVIVEGTLEIPASLRILREAGCSVAGIKPISKSGCRAFWKDAHRYNEAAAHIGPVLGLADLEGYPCPSGLMAKHLKRRRHPNFVLRVAERMLESWFLADPALARFLGVSPSLLPANADVEPHPKRFLVDLARGSRFSDIRFDLVPEQGSKGIVGKGYTPRMTEFIEDYWQPGAAGKRSDSLRRALAAIRMVATSREVSKF